MSEFIKRLTHVVARKKERDNLIRRSTKRQLNCIRNVCYNICNKKFTLSGTIKKKIIPYKQTIRDLANKNKLKSIRGLRNRLIQRGGFLPALLPVLLGLLTSVGGKLAQRAIGV